MIGYLQSKDRIKDQLRIGPDEETVLTATEAERKGLPMLGSFSMINGRQVLFYRWNGELRLRVDETPSINLSGLHADWSCKGNTATFILKSGNKLIWSEAYPLNSEIQGLSGDPTPYVEAEDFDFFLFVRNVLCKPERANRIYQNS